MSDHACPTCGFVHTFNRDVGKVSKSHIYNGDKMTCSRCDDYFYYK